MKQTFIVNGIDVLKQIDELKQENKELKNRVNEQWKFLEQCGINSGGELRRAGYIINDFVQLSNKYRSVLEEIRELLNKECGIISNAKAVGIINEVLGNEGN